MANDKVNPRSPGKSSDSDCFKNPHGSYSGPSSNNARRSDDGTFSPHPRGGESPDGEKMVEKYRPRGSGGGKQVESGSELNEEGTDWA